VIRVGIVGLGYWGQNLLRNFYNHPDVSFEIICDIDEEKIRKQIRQYPKIEERKYLCTKAIYYICKRYRRINKFR